MRMSDEKMVRYRPVSLRRRALIAVLAVVTALVIVTTMLDPMARLKRFQQQTAGAAAAPPPLCTDGRLSGCVGGMAEVIPVLPAAARAGSAPA
jgi:hypothetical protein